MLLFSHLECSSCGKRFEPDKIWNLCNRCQKPLLVRYDLQAASRQVERSQLAARVPTIWRYHELLPVGDPQFQISLGEGFTELVRAGRLAEILGFENLYIKDEGTNPTGSFKARGLCIAIARALELGIKEVVIPSAGNAAGATSAYAARAGIKAYVYMPRDVPQLFVTECRVYGAEVQLIDGLITDCGAVAARDATKYNRFNLATLQEPYRLEGKKTLGYELAEQMNWNLPDVIIYPTGGGTGLIGMWKAFEELEVLGWIGSRRPRMVAVQSQGCAPIVKAFKAGKDHADAWPGASTIAEGIRVPKAIGDALILRALYDSGGTAVAVHDTEILEATRRITRSQGLFACPEGGATLAAFQHLRDQGWIRADETVVLFNTGNGLKYSHLWD